MNEDHGGSVEVGGNGLCYNCGKNLATAGGWNCQTCKDQLFGQAAVRGTHTIPQIQKKLLEMAEEERLKIAASRPTELFGYPSDVVQEASGVTVN